MKQIDFLGKQFFAFAGSGLLILASFSVISTKGLNYGIDFAGGTEIVVKTKGKADIADIRRVVEDLGVGDALIQRFGSPEEKEFLIRIENSAIAGEEAFQRGIREPAEAAGWQEAGEGTEPEARPEGNSGGTGPEATPEVSEPEPEIGGPTPAAPAAPPPPVPVAQAKATGLGDRILAALRERLDTEKREGAFDLNGVDPQSLAGRLESAPGIDPAETLPLARSIVSYRRQDAGGIFSDWAQVRAVPGLPAGIASFLEKSAYLGSFVQLKADVVGPTIGRELRVKAMLAIFWSLAGILAYVWLRFELRFSVASIVALVHDVIITVGVLAFLGEEFSLPMIAALLTIVGYSLNDTIVVFDRVRENLRAMRGTAEIGIFNGSINQTLSRTLLTSGTTLLVVISLLLLGGPVIHGFALAMFIGIIVGTYSSIYVASPVAIYWQRVRTRLAS